MGSQQAVASLAELADARIEACLSACEGVDTETLERLGESSLTLTRDRLTRYQEFTRRLLGVLVRVKAMHPLAPSDADLAVLGALRVEAALLLHQEAAMGGIHAEH